MNYRIPKHSDGVTTIEGEQDARDFVKTINIPTITVSDTNLSPNEKFVIGIVNSFQANNREFFASNKFIANSIGIKPGSVQNILTSLEKKGYLVRTFYDQDKKMRKGISLSPAYISAIHNVSLENDRVSLENDRGVSLNNDHTIQDNTIQVYKNKNKPKRKKFTKPTVEEITNYCKERRNNIKANKFYDYYESKGWLVGKSPMKDWKAAIRTWEGNSFNAAPKEEEDPFKDVTF